MRHRPSPLLRLSAGLHDPAATRDDNQITPTATQFPSLSHDPITAVHNHNIRSHNPSSQNITYPSPKFVPHSPAAFANPPTITVRSVSAAAPRFSSMFRLGSRPKSPRRANSAMYANHGGTTSSVGNPGSPTAMSVVQDPHQRPFSPWSSTDSQSSTSPRNSTVRGPQSIRNKRSLSPTTSVSTAATGTSIMTKSSRSFLTGRRKHSSGLNEEFDPTTFRKNRSRPSLGAKGQDAVYQEYDDLFEDELEDMEEGDEGEEDETDGVHPSDGNEDEDGFFLLQIEDNDHEGRSALQQSPHISPKTRGNSLPPPQPQAPPPPPPPPPIRGSSLQHPVQASYLQLTSSAQVAPPPPTPPPKSWRRSIVNTTTPPRSTAPSVDGSQELQQQPTTVVSAPPTPPPKPSLLPLDTNVNFGALPPSEASQYVHNNTSISLDSSDPFRGPPAAALRARKRFSKRLSGLNANGNKRPRSIPEGLGIINIPSPTLFYSGFSPAAGDGWSEQPSHAPQSPALTNKSFTPRQPAFRGSVQEDSSMIKGMAMLFDEADGIHSDPGEGAVHEVPQPLNFNRKEQRQSTSTQVTYLGSDAGTIKVKLEVESDNLGDLSAVTDVSVETLLDSMLLETSESENEMGRRTSTATTATAAHLRIDTSKEVVLQQIIDDGKEVVFDGSGLEAVDYDSTPKPAMDDEKIPVLRAPVEEKELVTADTEEGKPDAAYLRAFRAFVKASGDNDAFVSRAPRYDAIQAQRICSHLRREFPLQVSENSVVKPKKRRNSKVRHREAGEEIMTSLWALMALRWLNFGKVIISPGHQALLAVSAKQLTRRATMKFDDRAAQMLAEANSPTSKSRRGSQTPRAASVDEKERRRVLDLGGMPVADWGWHCAMDYPKVKVYTVTQRPGRPGQTPTSATTTSPTSPTSPQFRGPRNHRHLAVERLYRLPFPANHFDVVSARTLFLILKTAVPSKSSPGQILDEYERCLEECIRVLKPGGYLEFALFDHDVVNAGPLSAELSERFGQQLRLSGRDPEPTKRWISRLNKAGFDEIRRSWLFLPMAPPQTKPKVPSKDDDGELSTPINPTPQSVTDNQDMEIVKEEVRRRMRAWEEVGVEKGSIEHVAGISGLVGGWSWEKWMQIAGMQDQEEKVGSIMEEAKERTSGWRCLVGWARKPQ